MLWFETPEFKINNWVDYHLHTGLMDVKPDSFQAEIIAQQIGITLNEFREWQANAKKDFLEQWKQDEINDAICALEFESRLHDDYSVKTAQDLDPEELKEIMALSYQDLEDRLD